MTQKTKKEPKQIEAPRIAPGHLSERCKMLWTDILSKKKMETGRLVVFQSALEALDRADAARIQIDNKLTVLTPRSGCEHSNPLLKTERENRQLFAKLWMGLGLHVQPVKSPFPSIYEDD